MYCIFCGNKTSLVGYDNGSSLALLKCETCGQEFLVAWDIHANILLYSSTKEQQRDDKIITNYY